MGRVTRAMAAEAAEKHLPDNDTVLDIPDENADLLELNNSSQDPASGREPLGEIASNTFSHDNTTTEDVKKPGKGKKRSKKGGKKKQTEVDENAQSDTTDSTHETEPSSSQDEAQTKSSQISQNSANLHEDECCPNLGSSMSDIDNTKSTISPNALTSARHLDASNNNIDTTSLSIATAGLSTTPRKPTILEPTAEEQQQTLEPMAAVSALDAPASPLPSATPKVVANLKKERVGLRSTSNKENVEPVASPASSRARTPQPATTYDALEAAVIESATPPMSVRPVSSAAVPNSADAAVVATPDIQDVVPPSPTPIEPSTESSSLSSEPLVLAETVPADNIATEETTSAPVAKKVKVKKPAPVVRTTKASQARISMAHGDKTGADLRASLAKSRSSSMFAKSVGLSKSVGQKNQAVASQRAVSSGSDRSGEEVKKEVAIPHSKARPVSVSFPAPLKPIKSSKPPTKSTFQLPGEAVAAKLRAAKEERLKKEAEEPEKKPAFKARPAPTATKKAPIVRQTNSSKFRESIAAGKDAKTVVAELGHKRAKSVAAAGRLSIAAKGTAHAKPAPVKISARPSTSLANISKPRASLAAEARPITSKGTSRGKEVFNRPALAKEQADKEKREKEEAAKKARAEAAERGRQASREWAEKQKAKKMKDAEVKAAPIAAA